MDADKKMELPAIAGGEPVRKTKLFYGHQYIDEADVAAVTQVLTSDYLTCGPKVDELEARLCALTGQNMQPYAAMVQLRCILQQWQQV